MKIILTLNRKSDFNIQDSTMAKCCLRKAISTPESDKEIEILLHYRERGINIKFIKAESS